MWDARDPVQPVYCLHDNKRNVIKLVSLLHNGTTFIPGSVPWKLSSLTFLQKMLTIYHVLMLDKLYAAKFGC